MTGSEAAVPVLSSDPAPDAFAWSPDGTRLVVLTQRLVDSQSVGGTISTIDADLQTPPVTVRVLDAPMSSCTPTWQRVEP